MWLSKTSELINVATLFRAAVLLLMLISQKPQVAKNSQFDRSVPTSGIFNLIWWPGKMTVGDMARWLVKVTGCVIHRTGDRARDEPHTDWLQTLPVFCLLLLLFRRLIMTWLRICLSMTIWEVNDITYDRILAVISFSSNSP